MQGLQIGVYTQRKQGREKPNVLLFAAFVSQRNRFKTANVRLLNGDPKV